MTEKLFGILCGRDAQRPRSRQHRNDDDGNDDDGNDDKDDGNRASTMMET